MKKIFIVEDEKTLRDILEKKISRAGFQTLTAVDGLEAQHVLQRQKPDLMLLDLRMPRMKGSELLQWMKKEKMKIKTFILTNYTKDTLLEDLPGVEKKDILYKADMKLSEVVEKIQLYFKKI